MINALIVFIFILALTPLFILAGKAWKEKEIKKGEIKRNALITVGILVCLIFTLYYLKIYAESLWFGGLGYDSRFWQEVGTKWAIFFSIGAIVFVLWWLNVLGLKKVAGPELGSDKERREFNRIAYSIIGVIAIISGALATSRWDEFLLFFNQVQAGITDPVFQRGISFYLFSLPVQNFLNNLILWSWVAAGTIVGIICGIGIRGEERGRFSKYLYLWGIGFLFVLIWRIVLGKYYLLFSGGVVFGVGNADAVIRIPALNIMIALSIIAIVVLFLGLFWQRLQTKKIKTILIVTFSVSALFALVIIPAIYQQLEVRPNEIVKERPYLEHNIQGTLEGFGLSEVESREFDYQSNISAELLAQNQETLDNIRLWDWRPLLNSYQQRQRFTLYYEFPDIDIDRYMINGEYRQVMLAGREMDKSKFEASAQTWVNQRMKYTHGYGLVLNQVNEFSSGGMPNFLIKDIPTQSSIEGIEITQPEIYCGLMTDDHIIVKTGEQEFDYPGEDVNILCTYNGTGGVEIRTGLRKLALALKFDKERLFFSEYIRPDSRIMFHRQIEERLQTLAPFLRFDEDEYLVFDSQGKLWWIADAYTTSAYYPYSERYEDDKRTINYIRNSVKAVIDPYNGTVDLFVFDESDPIIQTYWRIFPDLFKPKSEMPADLMAHIRYPEDFISIQSKVYCTYHMTDPEVFYNKEDSWKIAEELYSIGRRQEVLPYYVIIRLPGESSEEFLQMVPFVPKAEERNNLVGWLAGRCDGENYGKALAFSFPKQLLVQGSMQFEARIDQDVEISEKLSLWGQLGSDVIRGNTLLIPVENTILYVEPVYLKAEQSEMPEIKRVIVAMGDNLEWGETFEEALKKLTGIPYVPPTTDEPDGTDGMPVVPELQALIDSADECFREYERATGEGNLREAGEWLERLKEVIDTMNKYYDLSETEG